MPSCRWAFGLGFAALLTFVACGTPMYERNPAGGSDGSVPQVTGGRVGTGGGPGGTGGVGGTGGSALGGQPAGGSAGSTTGGAPTGGATGGSAGAGGSSTGGRTGGASTGGVPTGGATGGMKPTGGMTGAAGMGGAATGGSVGGRGGSPATGGKGGSPGVTGALVHYSFDETTGTTAHDDVGTTMNATMVGATFSAGKFGNAATFSGTNQYVTLPAGLTTGLTDMSFAAWVKLGGTSGYQRIIDCGADSATGYWYLSPTAKPTSAATLYLQFGISTTDYTGEQLVQAPALNTGEWKHVALVVGATSVSLYVDGVVVATSSAATLRPKGLGTLPNGYLGKSQYTNDPYFKGQIDEMYLFDRALTAAEVATLAKGP